MLSSVVGALWIEFLVRFGKTCIISEVFQRLWFEASASAGLRAIVVDMLLAVFMELRMVACVTVYRAGMVTSSAGSPTTARNLLFPMFMELPMFACVVAVRAGARHFSIDRAEI